jgi:RimJ/RimL family protein N-acetyltransferase
MITLETDRLILRMLRESDLDAYAEICADPKVMRFIGDGQSLPALGMALAQFAEFAERILTP